LTTRLYAHACAAAAILLTTAACYAATLDAGWPALGGLYTAIFFTWSATRCYDQARREDTVERLLGRLGPDAGRVSFELPAPCCPFWQHSDQEIHAPGCPSSTAPASLTPRELQEFARITAAFRQPGGAA
jgi:hypothetical protein